MSTPPTLEKIPISEWKIFSQTIPTLSNSTHFDQNSSRFVDHLAKIIKENSDFFIFDSYDKAVSFDESQLLVNKYKALTTWFLGRFFHLLTCPHLVKKHDTIVEIQLCILRNLSFRQLDVYNEIEREYCSVFHQLVDFLKSQDLPSITLTVFVPDPFEDLQKEFNINAIPLEIHRNSIEDFLRHVLQFIEFILRQTFDFNCFNNELKSLILVDLLYLLSESSYRIKIQISNIFINILEESNGDQSDICFIFAMFQAYFEQLTYNVYNKTCTLSAEEFKRFETLLFRFLSEKNRGKFPQLVEYLSMKCLLGEISLETCKDFSVSVRNSRDFQEKVNLALKSYNCVILQRLKEEVVKEVRKSEISEETNRVSLINREISESWSYFRDCFIKSRDVCSRTECQALKFLIFFKSLTEKLIQVDFESKSNLSLIFFDGISDFFRIVANLNKHFAFCSENLDFSVLFDSFINFSLISNLNPIFILVYDILVNTLTNELLSQNELMAFHRHSGEYKKELATFLNKIKEAKVEKKILFEKLLQFLTQISCGLFEIDRVEDLQNSFFRIFTLEKNEFLRILVIESLPHLYSFFPNCERITSEILIPSLTSSNKQIQEAILKSLKQIICISSSPFIKSVNSSFEIEIHCKLCSSSQKPETFFRFERINFDINSQSSFILKILLKSLSSPDFPSKTEILHVLPACSSHLSKFNSESIAKIWIETCGDPHEEVRLKFAENLPKILKNFGEELKKEVIEVVFLVLLKQTKKSFSEANVSLQKTIMQTLQNLKSITNERIHLKIIINLLFFIILQHSSQLDNAINEIFQLSYINNTKTQQLYKQNKSEICQVIVDLCCANKKVSNCSLLASLEQISTTFDYYSAKDFVDRECSTLLPYFIAKQIRFTACGELVEEIATILNIELAVLLSSLYGNIFLYSFLNETKEDFKKCMIYLESTTKQTGPSLRKTNVWFILNELLLNFHEKRDKVLLALSLLAKEDDCAGGVQDYLQSRFLGLLKHFDLKLGRKTIHKRHDLVLLSLADLFLYMGAKRLTQFRFKIIAMLRTNDYNSFPVLNCRVWEAFLRSCEVEVIGPQLAIIFVSLLPLLEKCPREINAIFVFLTVENEKDARDHLKDLFFVVEDERITREVRNVIRNSLGVVDECVLREKIRHFLKYLNHESLEVRVKSMKHLKGMMEKNRNELDEMILGYNGIDEVIVELIDSLTAMCRMKDDSVKLAVGEVFGELGAVEPSHLPRRYSENARFFTFYIDDDSFVVNALGELVKALQTEKNTVNVDRFGVAIQEILKNNNISPGEDSSKNHLWHQFPEFQQEIMRPFLQSRYIIALSLKTNFSTPLYGSIDGNSFATWLINWTQCLISCVNQSHQSLLTDCLPAMKQDRRLLMQFLPHIVMHSIIDNYTNKESVYKEMKTVLSSFNVEKQVLNKNMLDKRPYFPREKNVNTTYTSEDVKQKQCAKVVFVILDFLDRWLREWQWQKGADGRHDLNFHNIKTFLARFCKLELAKCNYSCGEYPRALMYLEDYLRENPSEMSPNLTFLAQIYAQLDECDGVQGVPALQNTEPSIAQRLLSLEVSNKLSDAASCYEQMAPPLQLEHVRGLMQCYLDLDNVNTALNFARGADYSNTLLDAQAEPLWRLGRYEDLSDLISNPKLASNKSWGVEIGRILLNFQKRDRESFRKAIDEVKLAQVNFLGATSLEEGVYQQGYNYIANLHALNELEQIEGVTQDLLLKGNDGVFVKNLVEELEKEWELRIKVVQESIKIKEPILCMRRVGVDLAKRIVSERSERAAGCLEGLLGECWILSAKTARTAGIQQQAYTYNLRAEPYGSLKLFLEKAKLHWLREEHEQALRILQRGIEEILETNKTSTASLLPLETKKICAEAKLLIATYNESLANVDTDVNVLHYKEAMDVYREWETSLVSLGRFYDRLFDNMAENERDSSKGSDLQIHMINYFGKSLQYGSKFVYQSMPRLLSIWFDYGTRLLDVSDGATREERKSNLLKMTKLIDNFLERLPAYVFLTAFSQLVSRICHPQKEVYRELTAIIIKLLLKYPQQTLWMMVSVITSSYAVRAKICVEILNDSRLRLGSMAKLVKDFRNLAEKLIELCNKEVGKNVGKAKVSDLLRGLPRMLSKDFSEIMIPTHKFRKLVLPNPDFTNSQHNPFPNRYVHIVGIEEEIVILHSLQRPRKITFRGSDGKCYIQMLKPKDDLRKDFRLMEFNDIVNQLLSLEPESRQRRLNIRLYSVVPLNEECGLIEWIPNLLGLRPILLSIYKQRGQEMTARELKEASCHLKDSLAKKREVFLKKLIPRHPPVLADWFRRTFPDAQSWFFARTAYTRTTAVISMVGYILGLGDRHGENILFDALCGDTVHVDFNCLFNKGESFEWPERVPFRLTHNMISAMGPLGVEGVFRKSCACTLRVLRNNANTLMSIVTPFVYDPLVSWPRNVPASAHSTAERTNEQAVEYIKNIRLRLQGQVKTRARTFSIPLSVDGQTNNLINEAKSVDNLCQMYIGWGGYL